MSNTENQYQFLSNIPILLDGRPVEKITAFLCLCRQIYDVCISNIELVICWATLCFCASN